VTLQEYLAQANAIDRDGLAAFTNAATADALEAARIALLGDRQGRIKALQEGLRAIPPGDKPAAGKRFNEVRTRLAAAHHARVGAVAAHPAAVMADDLSLPPRRRWRGAKHPVTRVVEEIEGIFRELGFTIAQGPEAENE